ncbi:MAG: class I SAM-dependent methyltransferase [Bacteroidetes bacterium]|nr:MAG: class I SAM-dependent methyltransferase [Bacteroidota bacterium]
MQFCDYVQTNQFAKRFMKLFSFYISFFRRWLRYYLRAGTWHDVHSPFVSRLMEEVVENRRVYYTYFIIEKLREKLLNNPSKITITDHGAGSKITDASQRRISDLAKNSAIAAHQGKQLFNLVRMTKPKTMLEFGTSLGISALYQAGAAPLARFITMEGCPNTARVASNNLKNLGMNNIEVMQGPFRDNLPKALNSLQKVDFIFLDGDHQEGATMSYFEQCLPYLHDDSVFVIADIYWSASMAKVWQSLKSHPQVTLSIDLFHFGILFFRSENRVKQDFTLIKYKLKPWRLGFFQ